MSDRPIVGPITHLRIDANDSIVQEQAVVLLEHLFKVFGVERGVAIALACTYEALAALLIADSPMPEANIAEVRRLLDALVTNVRSHERLEATARRLSSVH